MSPEMQSNSPFKAGGSNTPKIVGAVLAVAVVAGAIGLFTKRGAQPAAPAIDVTVPTGSETPTNEPVATTPDNSTSLPSTQPTTPPPAKEEKTYADGTYSAEGVYVSPAGQEKIMIGLTVKAGEIIDATFSGSSQNPISQKMQDRFNEGFKEQVVGKPIDSVSLSVVNGASLVSKGFMDALVKIKAQAAA